MTQLEIGAKAPEFTAESTQGLISLPELLAGSEKGVIVYFYPKASTPGCTTQACDFRDNLNTMKAAGYTVVGVSADPIPALEKFTQKQGLNFPLISDPEHAILEPWGAWGEKKNYGRIFTGIIRSTIVVGKDGTVALAQYNVKTTGHVARLCRDLGLDD